MEYIYAVVDGDGYRYFSFCSSKKKAIKIARQIISEMFEGTYHFPEDEGRSTVLIYKTKMNSLIEKGFLPTSDLCWTSVAEERSQSPDQMRDW